MLDKLSLLISDIECRVPNPDGTFAEVLEFLRELQRLRAALASAKRFEAALSKGKYRDGFELCLGYFEVFEAAERARGKAEE